MVFLLCSGFQPPHPLFRIAYLGIIREQEFAQGVLRIGVSLLRRLLKPVPGIHPVRCQQRTIPPQLSHEVLRVLVTTFRQLVHFIDRVAALFECQALVPDRITKAFVVIGSVSEFLRLALLLHALVLKEQIALPDVFRLLDDGVFNLPERFLL